MNNKYSFTNILVISIGGLFIISILFLMGYGMISSISFDSPSKSSLEKYYESHPDQYRKDMNEQGKIQDIKKDLQNKIDEQNLR
jgi:5-bromo-4-chloroindolyl phosphate hydrolysis protein